MTTETRAHTFDGIQEFDNRLPNWWLWSFYLAVIFSVGYWIHYHTLGTGDLPPEAYRKEQAAAAAELEQRLAASPITNESLARLASEPAFVAEGRQLFEVNCVLCHRRDGAAGEVDGIPAVGVNLTDDFWIYGSAPKDVYDTIWNGRGPDKELGTDGGMQKWDHLGIGAVQRLTAYVLSLKGTNVAGGKAPKPYAKKEQ